MKQWFTAQELAGMGLPGMATHRTNVDRRAKRDGWAFRERQGRGGGREYPLSALPAPAREALLARALTTVDVVPATRPPTPMVALRAHQRAAMEARARLLAEVDRLAVMHGLSTRQAVVALVEAARLGTLRPDLASAVAEANARGGRSGRRTLSIRTVQYWIKARDDAGVAGLATRDEPRAHQVQGWEMPFLRLWARPSNISLAETLRDLDAALPAGVTRPSYDQARRFLRSLSPQERELGRRGRRAMVALCRFTGRDTSGLAPTDIYTSDGKSIPVEVENPLSGRPFRPEITTVLDVATRRAVGWSAALSENTEGVRAAFIDSLRCGAPAIWYTDNGPGFDNHAFDAALLGVLARAGTTNMDSLPDRSHSRGIIERFQQAWNTFAKKLPTYVGRDMDQEAKQAVFKRTRKDLRETGQSRLILPWADFLAQAQAFIDRYNSTPHSALPLMRDPITGKRRHMSPDECWAQWEADGWAPTLLPLEDRDDLARPMVVRTTNRALVEVMSNAYYHPALEPFHGETVAVSYDIRDASKVWVREIVRTADAHRIGRLICVAEWNAHKTAYVPVPVLEQARERRTEQAVQRLERKKADKLAELSGPRLVEHQSAEPAPLTIQETERAEAMLARVEIVAPTPRLTAGGRPIFHTDTEWARWVVQHPTRATPQDGAGLREKLRSRTFRDLCDLEGIDVAALQEITEQLRGVA